MQAALRLADVDGVEALSMRKLAGALGVEAMSLYKHVADKDAVLDGLVEEVVREIGPPREDADWRTALRHHARATREACLRHRWAATLIEARGAASASRMRYADSLLGLLLKAGFTVPAAYRAHLLVDSYLYGFVMQEVHFPADEAAMEQLAAVVAKQFPDAEYPALAAAMAHVLSARPRGRRLYETEFELGLGLILDGLERARVGGGAGGP